MQLLKCVVDDLPEDLGVRLPLIPESVLLPFTYCLTNCEINLLDESSLVLGLEFTIQQSELLLVQLILKGELELNFLTLAILDRERCSGSILELSEVKVHLGSWELDELIGGAQEVPTTIINFTFINLLR